MADRRLAARNEVSNLLLGHSAAQQFIRNFLGIHDMQYYIRILYLQYLCNVIEYYNRDMLTLRERLVWARQQKSDRDGAEFTQKDLARLAGVTQGNIAHLESGRTLTSRNIVPIAQALAVDPTWLAEGKGEPFSRPAADLESLGLEPVETVDIEDDHPEVVTIEQVVLKVQAGITGFSIEIDRRNGSRRTVPRDWVERKNLSPKALYAITVKGDSMEPTLYDGDTVIINVADTHAVDGEVFVVNYEGEVVVKRLSRDMGRWWLTSDNSDQRKYAKKSCEGEHCIIVGRVVRRESDRI